ncbi:MAG: PEP-CTERM sorting domain-containing protein [Proteobacteria bacterium]|nr:PEP-CTERM sorting domain-containing protein [Pseudomonadota bacterium]
MITIRQVSFFSAFIAGSAIFGLSAGGGHAASVGLQNGSATFSETCDSFNHSPGASTDGVKTGFNGWSIATNCGAGDTTQPHIAVWETVTNVTANTLEVELAQTFTDHLLGNFRLSVTSDDRSTFADGLETGGGVTANWTVLTGAAVTGPASMTFTTLGDNSILAGGAVPATGTYTLAFTGAFLNLTGLRLEVLEHVSLPFGGPGLQGINGNFVLTEISLDASNLQVVPVPAALPLFASGLAVLGFAGWRRRRRGAA